MIHESSKEYLDVSLFSPSRQIDISIKNEKIRRERKMEIVASRLLLQQPPSRCRLLFTYRYHNKRSRFIHVVDHARRPDHLLLMEVLTNDTFLKIVVTTTSLGMGITIGDKVQPKSSWTEKT
jgi:hypothetical protein